MHMYKAALFLGHFMSTSTHEEVYVHDGPHFANVCFILPSALFNQLIASMRMYKPHLFLGL